MYPCTAQIVGEAPNLAGRHSYDTASGRRMRALLGQEIRWQNLLERPGSASEMRAAADSWIETHGDAIGPLLLLGRKVCSAFGLPDAEWLEWYRRADVRASLIAFPHPSGLSHWWNDPDNARRAAELCDKIGRGVLPLDKHKIKIEEETA